MSTIRANSITNSAGSGAPDFPNGLTSGGVTVAPGTQTFTATGSLSTGQLVGMNADGTVSLITPLVGADAVFESASTSMISATFDTLNSKLVIAYSDVGNSGYATAAVGTVSGSTITFGTPVVVYSTAPAFNNTIRAVFDSVNNKVVVLFADNSATGRALVGTVSGTSISFGTAATFGNVNGTYELDATFDSLNGKVVLFNNNTILSSRVQVQVGTVSGTTISFGAVALPNASLVGYAPLTCTFDATNGKVVLAYRNNSVLPVAVVGTVSGTTISFGTTFSMPLLYTAGLFFDPSSGKVLAADTTKIVVLTVSGTSLSASAATTVTNGAVFTRANTSGDILIVGTTSWIIGSVVGGVFVVNKVIAAPTPNGVATFATGANVPVVAYPRAADNFGVANTFSVTSTAPDWVGVAAASIADEASGPITVLGGVASGLLGLTANRLYTVNTKSAELEITNSLTSAVGRAISTTTMLLTKGTL